MPSLAASCWPGLCGGAHAALSAAPSQGELRDPEWLQSTGGIFSSALYEAFGQWGSRFLPALQNHNVSVVSPAPSYAAAL